MKRTARFPYGRRGFIAPVEPLLIIRDMGTIAAQPAAWVEIRNGTVPNIRKVCVFIESPGTLSKSKPSFLLLLCCH